MKREEAKLLESLLGEFVKKTGLERQLRTVEIFDAWDTAVGEKVAQITSYKFFKDGILYCTISSSVIRNQLHFQVHSIIGKINSLMLDNPVKKIVIK